MEGHGRSTSYVWNNHDVYASGPSIWVLAFSIVNDEGAWRGIPGTYLRESASGDQVLVGEDAYDGYTAIATVAVDVDCELWTWHGWIIEGSMPPLPEEPEAIP